MTKIFSFVTDKTFTAYEAATPAEAAEIYKLFQTAPPEWCGIVNTDTGETLLKINIHTKLNQIMKNQNLPAGFQPLTESEIKELENVAPKWEWETAPRFIGFFVGRKTIKADGVKVKKDFDVLQFRESSSQIIYDMRANVNLDKFTKIQGVSTGLLECCITYEGTTTDGMKTYKKFSFATK